MLESLWSHAFWMRTIHPLQHLVLFLLFLCLCFLLLEVLLLEAFCLVFCLSIPDFSFVLLFVILLVWLVKTADLFLLCLKLCNGFPLSQFHNLLCKELIECRCLDLILKFSVSFVWGEVTKIVLWAYFPGVKCEQSFDYSLRNIGGKLL
jgi:hypothetical protein